MLLRKIDQPDRCIDFQLPADIAPMRIDSKFAYIKLLSDLSAGVPLRDLPDDLHLPRRDLIFFHKIVRKGRIVALRIRSLFIEPRSPVRYRQYRLPQRLNGAAL